MFTICVWLSHNSVVTFSWYVFPNCEEWLASIGDICPKIEICTCHLLTAMQILIASGNMQATHTGHVDVLTGNGTSGIYRDVFYVSCCWTPKYIQLCQITSLKSVRQSKSLNFALDVNITYRIDCSRESYALTWRVRLNKQFEWMCATCKTVGLSQEGSCGLDALYTEGLLNWNIENCSNLH